jgi:hypothetical protein
VTQTFTIPPPPPGGGGSSTAIGVPAGYTPPTTTILPPGDLSQLQQLRQHDNPNDTLGSGPFTLEGTAPSTTTYNEGDQFKPQNLPPSDVYSLQQQLVKAGVLSQTNVRPGIWDTSSADAYKTVLGYANATGMKVSDALKQLVNNPQLQASASRLPFQLTAPADIQAAVQGGGPGQSNTARDLIGHDLSTGETADFLKWYQDQEKTARAQYNSADLAGPGNSYTGAPNLNAAAQAYIKQHNLGESVAYGTASRMLSFFQLLKGLPGL